MNPLEVIKGNKITDDRGFLLPTNLENFVAKRFYLIKNHTIGFIRAYHGHKEENKYLFVVKGSIRVKYYPIDGNHVDSKQVFLTEGEGFLIPNGYYHGFQNLSEDTLLMVLSDKTFDESKTDDFRSNYGSLKYWDTKDYR